MICNSALHVSAEIRDWSFRGADVWNLQQRCYLLVLPCCRLISLHIWPGLHLNIALCSLTLFHKHTEEKPAGENLSKVRLYGKGTDESREIFPEFVEISSRQNLHSFAALGKLIILTAEWKLVQNAQTFDNLSKGDDFTQVQKKEKYFILYLWNWNESHLL